MALHVLYVLRTYVCMYILNISIPGGLFVHAYSMHVRTARSTEYLDEDTTYAGMLVHTEYMPRRDRCCEYVCT